MARVEYLSAELGIYQEDHTVLRLYKNSEPFPFVNKKIIKDAKRDAKKWINDYLKDVN